MQLLRHTHTVHRGCSSVRPQPQRPTISTRQLPLVCHSGEGVADLLARDRK